jgi:hypothetical protein
VTFKLGNVIGVDGVSRIRDALVDNKTLKSLNLSGILEEN